MTGPTPDPRTVARLLRQRAEMGGPELFLEGLSRQEALSLAAGARTRSVPAPGPDRAEPRKAATRAPGLAQPQALPVLPASYEELRAAALECTRCRLSETRTHVVFSDGAVPARLVVVGEAPGANEDATGLPFVGAAGQFLDLLLATVGLSRKDSVYICNVLKCRPPGNRNPLPEEIAACSPFLKRQLDVVAPQALLAVGSFAAQALTGDARPIGRLRGEVHSYESVPLVVTYHPAALLRNPGWTRAFWDDLQLLREVMDGG
ncbi:MAG: uracil-DNA glycosylase [Longimicrobiales bacterium]